MRAALVLVVFSFVTGACGAAEERSGGSSASTSESEEPTKSVSEEQAKAQQPPPFVLVSDAGEQRGVQGSSCVQTPDVIVCSDTLEPDPKDLSVVRPGEVVKITLEGVDTVSGEAAAFRLGCRRGIASVPLRAPSTFWKVELDPGVYELDLFVEFGGEDKSGDTSASLGLLVDETAPVEVVPATGYGSGCGQSK